MSTEEEQAGDGDAEPFTLHEYEESLIMALEGVARIARHLENVLRRQERSGRFARSITELRAIYTLTVSQAARLAEHYGTSLMWSPDNETAPVAVPARGSGGRGDRFVRLLANAFAEIAPSHVRVEVGDGELWYAAEATTIAFSATGLAISDWLADDEGPREEALTRISSDALARLQRFVTETAGRPWPVGAVEPSAKARVEDGKLLLWLEEGGAVLLECRPIEL